jgi:hypothetical protein
VLSLALPNTFTQAEQIFPAAHATLLLASEVFVVCFTPFHGMLLIVVAFYHDASYCGCYVS